MPESMTAITIPFVSDNDKVIRELELLIEYLKESDVQVTHFEIVREVGANKVNTFADVFELISDGTESFNFSLKTRRVLQLSEEDSVRFAEALINPPEPNEALVELLKKRKYPKYPITKQDTDVGSGE